MSRTIQVIIVGRGLAGAILSEVLLARGKEVLIIDDHGRGSSSQVAAGLYNPLVLKRHLLSWKATVVLPIALEFYAELEKRFAEHFIIQKELAKLFTSEEEIGVWNERMKDPEQAPFMSMGNNGPPGLKAPFGHGQVHGAGWVKVNEFLAAHKARWASTGRLIEEELDLRQVRYTADEVHVHDLIAEHLILCEGHRAAEHSLFGSDHFKLVKGEVLDLKIDGLEFDHIISRGFFLMPLGGGIYKAGSTFVWDYSDDKPTADGRENILERVRSVLPKGTVIAVLDHVSGIRPASKDRRPILGRHSDHARLSIFNGLGARGVMYAPWCAQQLAAHLFDGAALDPEMDVARFADL